jgi:hypothetical protein
MSIREAIARFRQLHERRRGGSLPPEELASYGRLRDEFYTTLMLTQRLALQPGQEARQSVRVATAKKVQLVVAGKTQDAMTSDVGASGFAAFVGDNLPVETWCDFTLHVSGHALRGLARVVACSRHGGGTMHRASFVLEAMGEDDRARLEIAVLDAALAGMPK